MMRQLNIFDLGGKGYSKNFNTFFREGFWKGVVWGVMLTTALFCLAGCSSTKKEPSWDPVPWGSFYEGELDNAFILELPHT